MDARSFAITVHGDQLYDEAPDLAHLEAMVQVLRDFGYGRAYVDAGWLHDLVEDTGVGLTEIVDRVGPEITTMVDAVSGLGSTRVGRNAHIYASLQARPSAVVVKLADRIANFETLPPGSEHATRYVREAYAFVAAVRLHVPSAMWERLQLGLLRARGRRRLRPCDHPGHELDVLALPDAGDSHERAFTFALDASSLATGMIAPSAAIRRCYAG